MSTPDNTKSIESFANLQDNSQAKPMWAVPRPYEDESDQKKVEIISKWVLIGNFDNILNGTTKITNITTHLENMHYNGYLRLFGIDLCIIQRYMTDNSWILLEDFKQKHKNDKWICPQCQQILEQNTSTWQCGRCLFWHHENCSQPKVIKRQQNSDLTDFLCLACFFVL